MSAQVTDTILMIRPVRFGYNPQTAGNNAFQQSQGAENEAAIQAAALAEFDAFAEKLRSAGVRVLIFSDRSEDPQPDSIFPNNWFSTHSNGYVFLYPMYAPNRRAERRLDIIQTLQEQHGLPVNLIVDLSPNEISGRFLEGTGSMVIDRAANCIYACLSPRTEPALLAEFAQTFGFSLQCFEASDDQGREIYHTNVVMHIGEKLAVICLEAVAPDKRDVVRLSLESAGKTILTISHDQMNRFAGNMLELRSTAGRHYTVMSQQALEALHPSQRAVIEALTPIIASQLDTIERFGGGSARCMMAEVFLGA